MKENISKILKDTAKKRNITLAEIAEKTNLSTNTITNVMYNRSRKKEHIFKIADFLGIELSNPDLETMYRHILRGKNVDIKKHGRIMLFLNQILHEKDISFPKELFQALIDTAYNYSINNNPSNQILDTYITALVDFAATLVLRKNKL